MEENTRLTAKESRCIAEANNALYINLELDMVFSEISSAVNVGRFEVRIDQIFRRETINKIKSFGYKVDEEKQCGDGDFTTIKW